MSETDRGAWRRTSPLAAVFFLGKIYEAIAKNAIQSFAPFAAFLVAYEGDLVGKAVFAASAFVIVTVGIAILRYWFFRYQIRDASILIRDGVIKKTQLDIKFDRIQAMNTEQNLVFRLFNLTTVRFDTAGSSQQEGALPGIQVYLAEELKARLGSVIASRSDAHGAAIEEPEPGPSPRTLLRLRTGDVVKVGLSSNRALIFLAFLAPLLDPLTEKLEQRFEQDEVIGAAAQAAETGIGESVATGIGIFVLVMFAVVAFLMTASIVGAFLRYHRFELQTDGRQFRSTGGLLTRHEQAIRFPKIQSLHVRQNLTQRLFGRFRLHAKQAASGRASSGKSFVVPLVEPDTLPTLAGLCFGTEFEGVDLDPASATFRPVSRQYLRSRFMLLGVLPAMAVTGLLAAPLGWHALWFLFWLPISMLYVRQRYRRLGVSLGGDGIAVRDGLLGFSVTAHLARKVQRVNVTQSPFQRRKGLATVRLFLASGSVSIPFIPAADAGRLRDHILYKVESSDLAWH